MKDICSQNRNTEWNYYVNVKTDTHSKTHLRPEQADNHSKTHLKPEQADNHSKTPVRPEQADNHSKTPIRPVQAWAKPVLFTLYSLHSTNKRHLLLFPILMIMSE